MGRGQKLGEGGEAVPFSDMTVEDLLGIVRSLPAEESAVAAISGGLLYLDSRALAALLKELSKIGLANRCGLRAPDGDSRFLGFQTTPCCTWTRARSPRC